MTDQSFYSGLLGDSNGLRHRGQQAFVFVAKMRRVYPFLFRHYRRKLPDFRIWYLTRVRVTKPGGKSERSLRHSVRD